ncbi:hypothetical protein MHM95_14315 [Pseudoalteromonas sp. CnMc7-15]|uniref:hypothetical protein n=1 Tax=unclassified Pseudoalteromonas TaxID=194690 RepID=UPI001EF40064|nr:hypothetical protein [Pseudoalteromonas sp. CnMc7-15]MCG7567457.1 hypothetical protein [Pseudoalteromonas sp. CnMc7-15]
MEKLNSVHELYKLPSTPEEQVKVLSTILDIPLHLSRGYESASVDAMCATILYRHLGRADRMAAMRVIRATGNPVLSERLAQRAFDTIINPQWHIWSLTNDELKKDLAFHKKFDDIAAKIGFSASAIGAKDLAKAALNQKRLGKKGWSTIVIWATVYFNSSELSKAQGELKNRTSLNEGSKYH